MQSGNPDEAEAVQPEKGANSFGRLLERARALVKKEKKSEDSPATPGTVTSLSYTRPRRHLNPTEEELRNHASMLQSTLNDTWPHRHHSRYRNVRALLVHWAGDGSTGTATASGSLSRTPPSSQPEFSPALSRFSTRSHDNALATTSSGASTVTAQRKVSQELGSTESPFIPAAHQLAGVLGNRYGIQSQVWMIPSLESPQEVLAGKVKQFVEDYGATGNLLIFWYGGHAGFASAEGEVMWYGPKDIPGISARTISKTLGIARADVLVLNDSPFAQHAYVSHINGPGTFELLGSGSMTPSSAEPNPSREGSFTRTLALMLDSPFLATHGVSVLELHRKLLDMMNPKRSSVDTTASASARAVPPSPISDATTETPQRYPRRLRSRTSFSSMVVAKAPAAAQAPAYPVYCQISQSTQLERDARRTIVLSRLNTPLTDQARYVRPANEPTIHVDLRLQRSYVDVPVWKEWFLRAPADAEGVNVKYSSKEG
ncbi:hypothetical protein F4808DRAFT_256388 [Astrocystis sublimbata]|nr:hypothetical protein F4808DRAFT_256388 [Astrocystis sublimbata]